MRVFTANIFMSEEEILQEEKALFEKFGEKRVVLPPFMKPHDDRFMEEKK